MFRYATGAAFVDRAGTVLGADPGFRAALGLPAEDVNGALRALADKDGAIRGLLRGEGPASVRVAGRDGAVELERHPAEAGALLVVRSARLQERVEHALRSAALSRLMAGMAHDIKNPLNAMALQLALLSEKLGPADASAPHLGALREQIGRVNEVVRRFMDVTDPAAPLGYTELGALVADVGALFGHEARRRRIQLVLEPPRGVVRIAGDPARVGSLVLVLLAAAMAAAPDGGRVEGGVEVEDGQAVLRLIHAVADEGRETGYDMEVIVAAASALGGSLTEQREEGVVRVGLRLPRSERS
ncbi:MAG TPA: histidine kinase dimerization/phospho-acceptor domain-containing protein [Anaeromyxobacter sp.]|nr:histidine kinase dimerization/phospho-acceptor domain-containing protein [Anaeromyxobacter sp.]